MSSDEEEDWNHDVARDHSMENVACPKGVLDLPEIDARHPTRSRQPLHNIHIVSNGLLHYSRQPPRINRKKRWN
jgi:hypothetical protein